MISEVAPTQKKKKKKTKSQPLTFTSLPYEIRENCLARISRWNHPKLSLVSKSFHSLLSSNELYKTRSQIGANESCVYVCLQLANHPYPSWFTLWTKPNQTLNKQKKKKIKSKESSSENVLVPIPSSSSSSHSPPVPDTSTIAVGSDIYVIGGSSKDWPSSAVRILDCRSHTWCDAPNMKVARVYASADVLDEKIYVMGGCGIDEYDNWLEVFDIKTQSWTAFPSPTSHDELEKYYNVVHGKLHVVTAKKDYTFDPKQGRWEVGSELSSFPSVKVQVWCEIENVIYCCTCAGYCMWYNFEGGKWEVIKGLERLRKRLANGSLLDMVNHGGKLLVVWEVLYSFKGRIKVWYAEISLETRCNGSEVWGEVEWDDVMLTVPRMSYEFEHCLVVSV